MIPFPSFLFPLTLLFFLLFSFLLSLLFLKFFFQLFLSFLSAYFLLLLFVSPFTLLFYFLFFHISPLFLLFPSPFFLLVFSIDLIMFVFHLSLPNVEFTQSPFYVLLFRLRYWFSAVMWPIQHKTVLTYSLSTYLFQIKIIQFYSTSRFNSIFSEYTKSI